MSDSLSQGRRVAIFHYELVVGGAEKVVADIFEVLIGAGYTPTIFTCYFHESNCFECFKQNKGKIKCCNFLPFCLFGYFQTLLAVVRNLLLTMYFCVFYRNQFDIAIVDTPSHVCIPLLKLCGVSVIFYCHYPDFLMANRGSILRKIYRFPLDFLEGKAIGMADKILCNSEFSRNAILRSFSCLRNRVKEEKDCLCVLYPFADSKKFVEFLSAPADRTLDCEYFVSLNRFEEKKNIQLAIKAFKCFMDERGARNAPDNFRLVIAGAFDNRKKDNIECVMKLGKLVDELFLDDCVTFAFSPTEQQKLNLIYNSIGLIYTPVEEHFGIVPLEAMLLKCPVIVMNSGGPLETVINNVTGYHCRPDPSAVANLMEKLTDISLRVDLGKNGLAHCQKNFSRDTFYEGLTHHIDTLKVKN